MRPWIKAGIIGAIPMLALTVLTHAYYFMPEDIGMIVLCIFGCVPYLFLYTATGVLAAFWQTLPRLPMQGATAGALAGLVATSIDGLFTVILTLAFEFAGVHARYLQQVSPQTLELIGASGTDVWWVRGGVVIAMLVELSGTIVVGVVLAALGGIVLATIKKN